MRSTPRSGTPEATSSLFDCDDIVKVRGTIQVYNDRLQLIVW